MEKTTEVNELVPLAVKGTYLTESTTTGKFHLVVVLERGLIATCNCPGGVWNNFNGCKHAKKAVKMNLEGVK